MNIKLEDFKLKILGDEVYFYILRCMYLYNSISGNNVFC